MAKSFDEFVERVGEIPDDMIVEVDLPDSDSQAVMANGMLIVGKCVGIHFPELESAADTNN